MKKEENKNIKISTYFDEIVINIHILFCHKKLIDYMLIFSLISVIVK